MNTQTLLVNRDADLRFVVYNVDNRIQLFLKDQGVPVFSRRKTATDLPATYDLQRMRIYCPVYDNNDGGGGFIKIAVEQSDDGVAWVNAGYEYDIQSIQTPSVMEFPFFICRNA